MKDLMLDLETFGNNSKAIVIQIGACYFDRYSGEIRDCFIENIDAEDSLSKGFEFTASTIYWWMSQSKEARESIIEAKKNSVEYVINSFNSFIKPKTLIWSHATFDFVILMNHFNKLNIKPNFHYRSARDLRTLVDLAQVDYKVYPKVGIEHNALDDCMYQVKYTVECFNKLKGGD